MKTSPITLGSWAFKTRTLVSSFAEQCRQITCKHKAETRMAEFLTYNFGTKEEHASMLLNARPAWADTEAKALLEYDRLSPFATGSNVIAVAFAAAKPLEAA